jgi:prepilin-type processing-associated H-X9-DG protein
MSLCIKGIGTAVPRHCIAQEDLAEVAGRLCGLTDKQRRLLPTLYRHAGVQKRHSVVLAGPSNRDTAGQSFYQSVEDGGPNGPSTADRMRVYAECATPLAAEACRRALGAARVAPDEITHLVTVSCSGFCAPGVDVQLFHELGLSPQVARTHVGFMGCHGALNGLRVARAFAEADPNACVLLCAIELCTLHQQYGWNPDQIVANALFADGSAAAVCVPASDEQNSDEVLSALSSASTIVPATEDLMSWRIGDNGFQMGLSPRVPDVIRATLRSWLNGWLATNGVALEQVGQWAIHPGGPRILQACVEALELEPDAIAASKAVLAEFGNMSSPTILFILDRLRRQSAPGPWVLLAFGPGLTIEAALVAPGLKPAAGVPAVISDSVGAPVGG